MWQWTLIYAHLPLHGMNLKPWEAEPSHPLVYTDFLNNKILFFQINCIIYGIFVLFNTQGSSEQTHVIQNDAMSKIIAVKIKFIESKNAKMYAVFFTSRKI